MSQFSQDEIRQLWKDACNMTQLQYVKKGTTEYDIVKDRFEWLKFQAEFAKASNKQRKWIVACHQAGVKFAKRGTEDYQKVLEKFKTIKDSDICRPPY
jgi:5'(3')-deoxyribonucleotidase